MTERLEEILKKSPFNQHTDEFLIKLEDMNEITKIVEELEEALLVLVKQNKEFRKSIAFYSSESYNAHLERLLDRSEKQIKRYREVLEFYADEENYEFETIVSDCDIEVVSKVLDDYGQKARNALHWLFVVI